MGKGIQLYTLQGKKDKYTSNLIHFHNFLVTTERKISIFLLFGKRNWVHNYGGPHHKICCCIVIHQTPAY
jgi:hypothetical protein